MPKLSRLATLTVVALVPTSVALVAPLSFSGGWSASSAPGKPKVTNHALVPTVDMPSAGELAPADAAKARDLANGRGASVRSASAPVDIPGGLAVIGVTWDAESGAGSSVQYRKQVDGVWGPWTFGSVEDEHAPDQPEGSGDVMAAIRDGSDPIILTRADEVQVRLLGPTGAPEPADPRLMVVEPEAVALQYVGTRPGAAAAAARRPYIYTRADWGADESLRNPDGPGYGAVKAAFVHHTTGSNDYTSADVPGIIQGIYAYHVGTYNADGELISGRGWADIGYNFLIDRFGRTWEGRYGGVTRPVIGAHAYGVNSYTFGVSVLGNFMTQPPPSTVTTALGQLIGWKAQIHEFNPGGKAKIGGVIHNGVSGHRNANATACPGDLLYAALPTIRAGALAQVKGVPSLTLDRDLDNRNDADVLATNAAGDLLLYSTTNARTLTGPITLETGTWTGRDEVHVVGDWSGDGAVDLVSRVQGSGALDLHRGTGAGGLEPAVKIGTGWSGFSAIIAPGDWNGDGRNDLVGRLATDGSLRLYPGNGTGGFGRAYQIGNGWGGMRLISGIGDWDGDGARDLLAVSKTGSGRVYRGNGTGGFTGSIALTGDWSARETVVGVGDASWDTKVDVLSVNAAGEAQFGLRGSTSSEVVWSTTKTSFADVEVYTG
ncbi:MAG TPA: FG-GAP-like repeat-containing protein [Dermatophilaceae bacterium]|nr:FG-GAP-like repeat-containing protein [Dermatophilaceae bacterium]